MWPSFLFEVFHQICGGMDLVRLFGMVDIRMNFADGTYWKSRCIFIHNSSINKSALVAHFQFLSLRRLFQLEIIHNCKSHPVFCTFGYWLIRYWKIWMKFYKSNFKIISVIDGGCVSCEITFRWISLDFTGDKSTLVHCPVCRTYEIATRFWVVVICPIIKCPTVLEFSFILFELCLFITIFNFILNYVLIVTFWIFTYHIIWILLIIHCLIWNYWIIYFLTCLEVFGVLWVNWCQFAVDEDGLG